MIKLEGSVNLCHWCHIFCGCTTICCRFHIYPRKAGFSVFYNCPVLWCVQMLNIDVFVCLHIALPHHLHHYADISEGIGLLQFLSCTSWLECVFKFKYILSIITLKPRQNGRHFADGILKCIFLNDNGWISLKISVKIVFRIPINNISA